jgi:rubredoxin
MGKHVCPVCEDVYAVPASVDVAQGDRARDVDGWSCPACGYVFVSLDDVQRLLEWAAEPYAAGTVRVAGRLQESATVVRREVTVP